MPDFARAISFATIVKGILDLLAIDYVLFGPL